MEVGAAPLPQTPREAQVLALKAEPVVERKPHHASLGSYIKIPFLMTQDSKAISQHLYSWLGGRAALEAPRLPSL